MVNKGDLRGNGDACCGRAAAETPIGEQSTASLSARDCLQIAFDLHDGPAQTVSAALLQLRIIEDEANDKFRDELKELKGLLVSASQDIYALIGRARQTALDGETLVGHVQRRLSELASRNGAAFDLSADGDESDFSPLLRGSVARIIDEAVNNAAAHSSAQHVHVKLQFTPDGVWCVIADDGSGFDLSGVERRGASRPRYGLLGMMERAELLGGACSIDTATGSGTRVRVWIPTWVRE